MPESRFDSITFEELARSQLEVALRLYLAGEEFPAVITLAGAAEEILGKIAAAKGFESALKRTVRELSEMFEQVWKEKADEKTFVSLRNTARNAMKHCGKDDAFTADFEREAAGMLARALENFTLCTGHPHPSQRKFTGVRVRRWRDKQPPVPEFE